MLRRNNLDGTLDEVRKLLDKAVLEERKELARALDDDARFNEMRIEELPPSTAQAVQDLADYNWRSEQARADYEKIRDLLGREVLDQRFSGMKQALEGATDEDREQIRQMLADLNQLLDAHSRGVDTAEQFAEFMDKHGQYFPDNPRNVEELLDSLAQRAAAAQRLRNSLSQEQRDELDALAQQAFGDPSLMSELSQLDQFLQAARPGEDWEGSQQFRGDNGMGLGEGTGALQDIAELESLADQLSQQYAGAALDDIDPPSYSRGNSATKPPLMLAPWPISKRLCRNRVSSIVHRMVNGACRPKPCDSSDRLLCAMSPGNCRHEPVNAIRVGPVRWVNRPERPANGNSGDTEPWDVTRTITNAVLRDPGRMPVRLSVVDVEVAETEQRSQAAVALLVDTSFSMVMEDRWVPMKRTALALNHLVSTRFRSDELQLIAFGRHAHVLSPSELAGLDGAWDQGTNLHHALLLAARHLRRHSNAQPVVLIVTDGEPTAHLEADGEARFDYPPSARTLGLTVRALDAVARLGAKVTFFRLGEDPGLARVVDRMAHRVGGRVIAPDLDGLGAAVVSDYMRGRR